MLMLRKKKKSLFVWFFLKFLKSKKEISLSRSKVSLNEDFQAQIKDFQSQKGKW